MNPKWKITGYITAGFFILLALFIIAIAVLNAVFYVEETINWVSFLTLLFWPVLFLFLAFSLIGGMRWYEKQEKKEHQEKIEPEK